MIIAALKEGETKTRVAITPSSVKQYLKHNLEVLIESTAGIKAGYSDEDYIAAGARIESSRQAVLAQTNILVSVDEPPEDVVPILPAKALLISHMENNPDSRFIKSCLKNHISVFSMDMIPRISRAQSLDSLSSQANLAGYRAVIEGAAHYNRALPLMMTAAGMIQPAKVLVLGAGVAGLQAIATAKRLGAVVYAFDVRTVAKEQVESLGAEFIEVKDAQDGQTASGYAGEVSEEYKLKQAALIDEYAKIADIVICTALIPGKKAPILLKSDTVSAMKKGAVIVDLATSRGGNCELSQRDKVIQHHQVIIVGYSDMAGLVAGTASDLYANNVANLINLLAPSSTEITFNKEDEIIQQGLLCHDGQYMPFQTAKEH